MKLRVIGRRVASLGISPRAAAAIRSAAIASWQGLRNRPRASRPSSIPV
jgi:hypothetical protein